MDDRSDAEIIAGSYEDPSAFAEIFDRHFVLMHGFLSRRVDPAAVDEIAGDLFCAAFEQRGHFDRGRDSAAPWLYGIATHLVSRWYRSEDRRERAYGRLLVRVADRGGDTLESVDDRLDAGAISLRLGRALNALAERDRDALVLLAWEDLSYEEIAIALGVPVGTVRSRLFRARRTLREALGSRGEHVDDLTPRGGHDG